jgi:iron-sulfur cluster assembly protein
VSAPQTETRIMDMTEAQKNAFKPVEKLDTGVAKDTVGISDAAVVAARAALAKRGTPDAAIRLGIRGGGCSGFSYAIEYDDGEPRTGDRVLEFTEDGKARVRFFVDKKSILYLGGSVLDWEKTLMFQGFKFKNPHESTRCGCGHSFTVA